MKGKIDCSRIVHKQIYAQLKQELLKGARYWFTAEEEHELKEHNKMFQRRSIMEEVLYACFRPATAEDRDEIVQRPFRSRYFQGFEKTESSRHAGS